jgi:hypothetical protein
MRYEVAGRDVTVTVRFMVDGDFVVPDASSVTYTLRGNDGLPVAGQTDVAVGTTDSQTETNITIAAVRNGKAKDFENRFVTVEFKVAGQAYSATTAYRLIDWLGVTVTGDDVRSFIGLDSHELADAELDLHASYYEIKKQLGGTVFDDALTAGDDKTLGANRAVLCHQVLRLVPSLRLRTVQREATDTASFDRYKTIDWSAIASLASAELAAGLSAIAGSAVDEVTIFQLTTRTDPVTGA